MLILHTAQDYVPTVCGVSEVVKQLSQRLARRGHEVHVVTGATPGCKLNDCVNGVHVHRFRIRGNSAEGISGDVSSYVDFVKSRAWDVVAMHCCQTWSTDALLSHLKTLSGTKVFVGHGISALDNPAFNEYFTRLATLLKDFDATVTLSPLLEETGFAYDHCLPVPRVIPNGVDPSEWSGPSLNVRMRWRIGSAPWIISVSNHSPVKGHSVFAKVISEIRRAGYPSTVGSIIGGYYPAAKANLGRFRVKGGCWYRCRLRSLHDRHLRLNFDVPRPAVVSALREADLLLVTSSREASPLVILEAMAAGTPWIAFDRGSIRENSGGVVVQSVEEMVEAAMGLLNRGHDCSNVADQENSEIIANRHWESITSEYERLYSQLVARAQENKEIGAVCARG